ncbi:MAG: SDR family NAD(P)-dependent oxidoreductase [Bacteroidota bacterium]
MKQALITGGSSGIGFALSEHFAKAGYTLLWVSENESQLRDAAGLLSKKIPTVRIETLCADLTELESCDQVYSWALGLGGVDVLVNGAGIGTYGKLQETDLNAELRMIRLNVFATYKLTRLFADHMLQKGGGRIGNIASNAILQPVPYMATYAATKSFVSHFSRSLHEEFKGTGVAVSTIIPPATPGTGFQQTAKMDGVRTFNGLLATSVDEVARLAYAAIMRGDRICYASSKLRWTRSLAALLPHALIQKLIRWELHRS